MSWDAQLLCSRCRQTLQTDESHTEGGTYVMGGTSDCELNVTYNYGKLFAFRAELDGLSGAKSVPILEDAVERFGTERDSDYWAAEPGNVGFACNLLLTWARLHPDGIWEID